jgi:hypothetical protein
MATRSNIAAIAAVITVLGSPAFAGDQDLITELRDSGRYYGIDYTANPRHASGAYAQAIDQRFRSQLGTVVAPQHDFQLEGR